MYFQFNLWFVICIYNDFQFGPPAFHFVFLFLCSFDKVFMALDFIIQIKFMILVFQ